MSTKVALVTAASQGIGLACAEDLAARGYALILLARSPQIHEVAKRLGALAIQGSVTEPGDLQKLVDLAVEHHGRIDAVVNNTGHPATGELLSLSDSDWMSGLELLVLNVVRMLRLTTPIMLKQETGGAIVNISTYAAREPSLAFPISSSLRGALSNFTKLYADQYAAQKIRINNVLPGFVDNFPITPEELSTIPMRRGCSPAEVAHAVAYLLSKEAAYITGQNLTVDGGVTRSL